MKFIMQQPLKVVSHRASGGIAMRYVGIELNKTTPCFIGKRIAQPFVYTETILVTYEIYFVNYQ